MKTESKTRATEKEITDYINQHYGGDDWIVEKCDWQTLPQSTINSPFETILNTDIVMHWRSPSHYGEPAHIFWNYR